MYIVNTYFLTMVADKPNNYEIKNTYGSIWGVVLMGVHCGLNSRVKPTDRGNFS